MSVTLAYFSFLVFCTRLAHCETMPSKYHSYEEMTRVLQTIQMEHPKIAKLYSIGKTYQGGDLWVMEVSAGEYTFSRPNVRLVGNIHGNEPVGKEVLLQFVKYLVEKYEEGDQAVRKLLEFARIHILPSLNPDGFKKAMNHTQNSGPHRCSSVPGRNNALEQTLSRDFPDFHRRDHRAPTQLETKALMKWFKDIPFVLSASLHGGALVASYPFDNYGQESERSHDGHPTDDDDVFKHLAELYSKTHPTMHLGEPCPGTETAFADGITNGAAWYPVTGGMADFNYIVHGCMELTLEISCCKFPDASELPKLWQDNKEALMAYVEEVRRTLRGVVMDEVGVGVANASVFIHGRERTSVRTSSRGEFWRILLPSDSYLLQVEAQGFHSHLQTIKINKPNPDKWSQFINITLYPTESSTNPSNQAYWTNTSEFEETTVKDVAFVDPSNSLKIEEAMANSSSSQRPSSSVGESIVESYNSVETLNLTRFQETNTNTPYLNQKSLKVLPDASSSRNIGEIIVSAAENISVSSTSFEIKFFVLCLYTVKLLT